MNALLLLTYGLIVTGQIVMAAIFASVIWRSRLTRSVIHFGWWSRKAGIAIMLALMLWNTLDLGALLAGSIMPRAEIAAVRFIGLALFLWIGVTHFRRFWPEVSANSVVVTLIKRWTGKS